MLEIDIAMPPDIQNEVRMLPSSYCRWKMSVIILLRNWMKWLIQLPCVSDKETEGKFLHLLYTVNNKDSVEPLFLSFNLPTIPSQFMYL